MSHIEEYYVQQAQTGSGMGYFAGSSTQKGAGIGSLLGGLFRSIFPFLKQGASVVGREALRAGSHILADAASGDVPLNTSLKQHLSEAGRNLDEWKWYKAKENRGIFSVFARTSHRKDTKEVKARPRTHFFKMSFLHNASVEALRTELALWAIPPTQTVLEGGQWIPYKPITSIDQSNTVEFCVPGTGNEYIDPAHTLLQVRGKIVDSQDLDFTADDKNEATPINYLLHSLWSQVDVSLNQKVISQSAMTYPYRSYIESLLAYDAPAKNSHMSMRMWYKDTAGYMDEVKPQNNEGLKAPQLGRHELTKNSKMFEVMGPIHSDFFNQDRFLLNNVELRIKLTRQRDPFVLMSTFQNEKLLILDATLLVRKVRISPTVLLGHAAALEKAPAKYPLTRVDLKTITIPAGLQDKTISNLHLGQIPKRIIIGFVTNQAFNGHYQSNPYNFQHFNLNYLSLFVDTQQIPAQPLTPDFERNLHIDAYNTLFSGTGIHWKDEGNDITYAEYPRGYTLYAFDISQDLSANESHWNLQRQGIVRMEVKFAKPLTTAVNCIVFSEFYNLIEIDKNRNVVVDYGV
ncbi:LOW QUALITY PROTEIN: hypothetical protein KUF71_010795 [Frankliniella fusca]|uniref:Uncharacterized protein n=1 Tax=Frankliniella fusca TaxID=407009 RepID=A0AAE1HI80_9NEOP|nr:LOW QUALITY PROTEIN: hypothetical protein KUF71_010795 [Frankliniella fusca]